MTGLQRIHSYLAEAPACPHHRALGWTSCPMIHVFRNCPKLWWELENLPYATKGNVEDSDPAAPDHAVDALRYMLVNLGGGPEFTVFDEPETNPVAEAIEPLEQFGAFGYRPSPDDPAWLTDDDDMPRRTVRSVE